MFEEDSLFSSPEGDFYQQMYDDQMALSLSNGGGMGLAPVIHRQLMSSYGNVNKDRSELPLDQGNCTTAVFLCQFISRCNKPWNR